MQNMVGQMDENCVMEEDIRPWVELVVLAAKPHQENVPWNKYQWRLCVSYQKLNQVTRLFPFHINHCNDSVQDIDDGRVQLGKGVRSDHENTLPLGGRV